MDTVERIEPAIPNISMRILFNELFCLSFCLELAVGLPSQQS